MSDNANQSQDMIITPAEGVNRRSIRNFLLQPFLQIQLGLVSVVLSLAFAGVIGWIFYVHLNRFAAVVIQLTDAEEEVLKLLFSSLADMRSSLLLAIFAFLIFNITASIIFTHKMVGPTVAFRRLIRGLIDGKYGMQIKLRSGDAFVEVADDLNELSRALAEKHAADGK
ncbi:hypothetical protein EBZ80_15360 [bacterium]|nr:hypothetical protein [bacterium]